MCGTGGAGTRCHGQMDDLGDKPGNKPTEYE